MDPTQGNDSPKESQGTDTPKGVTLDDVNRAITSRFRAFESKQEKTISEAMNGFTSKLDELLAEKLQPQPTEAADKTQKIEETPQFKAWQKQMSQLQAQYDAAKAERDAERAKTRDQSLRSKLLESLAQHGIEGVRAKHAVGFLVDADKRVRWSDDSDALSFKDASGEDAEFATGLGDWLKSDDAKIYLPPRGTAGSGDRPMSSNGRGGAPPDPYETARDLLSKHLGGQ